MKYLIAVVAFVLVSSTSVEKEIWNLKTTDNDIDHKRVPNLQVFFRNMAKCFPFQRVQ